MNYAEEMQKKEIVRLRGIQKDLPPFTKQFFRGIANRLSTKTMLSYAYDLRVFFSYIYQEHEELANISVEDLSLSDLEKITSEDIDGYLEYLSYYTRPDYKNPDIMIEITNSEKGKARKLATVRSMYHFFCKREKINKNPAIVVDVPRVKQKPIVRLVGDELPNFLDTVEQGRCDKNQKGTRNKQYIKRDTALVTLLLGTGMRVSECVGIDITDFDFTENSVCVRRKGGNEAILFFNEEVAKAVLDYLDERRDAKTKEENEKAFFLSNQGKRLCVRRVQILIKEYAETMTGKKITPHKLRSTFGTNLYQETGDIYLVATILGHNDVNTTKRHYAQIEESQRRKAVEYVTLRKG